MRVLIGCEKSHRVAAEFRKRGHDAWSCDIQPCEINTPYHIQDDVLNHLDDGWDMMIAHPDCTTKANSGVQWLFKIPGRYQQMVEDCIFFNKLYNSKIKLKCLEQPIIHKYARDLLVKNYDQLIQPYYFGCDDANRESKATCLWLVGLPPLMAHFSGGENIQQSVWKEPPGINRKANRSRTFMGIAQAMAEQWGNLKIV